MSAWPEPASFHDGPVKTLKYCKTCQQQTPHEVRRGQGVTAALCIDCLRRALSFESDRD